MFACWRHHHHWETEENWENSCVNKQDPYYAAALTNDGGLFDVEVVEQTEHPLTLKKFGWPTATHDNHWDLLWLLFSQYEHLVVLVPGSSRCLWFIILGHHFPFSLWMAVDTVRSSWCIGASCTHYNCKRFYECKKRWWGWWGWEKKKECWGRRWLLIYYLPSWSWMNLTWTMLIIHHGSVDDSIT